jgi:hypothetical protein
VGPNRYCSGGRNAATNAGSDSDTTNDGYAMRPDNANTYTECEFASSYTYTYTYPKFTASDTDANTSFEPDTNTYGELATRFTYATRFTHAYAKGNTEATADSASSAVR